MSNERCDRLAERLQALIPEAWVAEVELVRDQLAHGMRVDVRFKGPGFVGCDFPESIEDDAAVELSLKQLNRNLAEAG